MNYQELLNTGIRKLRIKHGLTQEAFAEKIGISIQGLSNIERNRYQPGADTVDKICRAFKIEPFELILPETNENSQILKNIMTLLNNCSKTKLKRIYEIIRLLVKM